MPLSFQTQKITKKYNALAHIPPEIGIVTCLTLKNVHDLDVEGHDSVVQGLNDSAIELPDPKNLRNKKIFNALAHIFPEL